MEAKKIKVQYEKISDNEPFYVNGAYGGFTPQGELLVQFYSERFSMHNNSELHIGADGSIQNEDINEEQQIIRKIQTGIIMNPAFLKVFHQWIGSKIDEFDMIQKNQVKNDVNK